MAHRRVVVTGLGIVAPNGIGKGEFWRNLSKSCGEHLELIGASVGPAIVDEDRAPVDIT